MGERVTTQELVARLEAEGWGQWTDRTVRTWLDEQPVPVPVVERGKPGREHVFDYQAVVQWLAGREERQRLAVDPRLEEARERARNLRLRNEELEGLSMPADEAEQAMGRLVEVVRLTVLGWPTRVARELEGVEGYAERAALLQLHCDRLLDRMARAPVDDQGFVQPVLDDEAETVTP